MLMTKHYSKCYVIFMNKTQVIHSTTNGHFRRVRSAAVITNAEWSFFVSPCAQVPECL